MSVSSAEPHVAPLTESVWGRPPGSGFAFRFGPAQNESAPSQYAGLPFATSIPLVLGVRDPASTGASDVLLFDAATVSSPVPDDDCWGLQRWRSKDGGADGPMQTAMQFELFQPLPALLDFSLVRRMPYHSREICIPALNGHFLVDNRLGSRPVEGFALLAAPGWRRLERHEPGTVGWGRGVVGVAAAFERAAADAGAELRAIRAAAVDAAFEDAETETATNAYVGFAFTVPAGTRRELHLAFGMYDHSMYGHSMSAPAESKVVSWSRAFFGGLEDVLEQALMEDGRNVHTARHQHAAFAELAGELSAEDLALVLASVREAAARPVLLQGDRRKPDRPQVVFLGTDRDELDAAFQHQFLNNALHPWVLRARLEDMISRPTESPNPAHWLILAASSAAATRQHDWLAQSTGGPEALAAFCNSLQSDAESSTSAPIRWLAALAAAMLSDGLGHAENAIRLRELAQTVGGSERPNVDQLLLPWTVAEYWQHLGTPVDLAPFESWRSIMAEHGCANFDQCCRCLGKRGGALGILLLGDRLVG